MVEVVEAVETEPLERLSAAEAASWFVGFLATAAIVAGALWMRTAEHHAPVVWGTQQVLLVVVVGGLLLAHRAPGVARCAAAAGAAAGVLVGVTLAQRAPTAWFMQDVAWHTAKVALTASGRPFDDPILHIPTIYPFAFSVLVGVPVALGVSLKTALWATTALSLTGTLAGYWFLARAFLKPYAAAWTAVALPLVFYAPMNGYWLLPNPFNASMPFVFVGLGLLALGTPGACKRKLPLAGAMLGLAGLLWYGHLLWIVPFACVWGWGRRVPFVRLVTGAAFPALVLVFHLGWVWRAGNLGNVGVTSSDAIDLAQRLPAMGRNLLTLTGDAALNEASWWIGALMLPAVCVAFLRRPAGGVDTPRVLRALAPFLFLCIVYAGLRLTYWRPFSWRYAFLLYSTLLIVVGGARGWSVAGRRVGPIGVLGLASLVCAPIMMRYVVEYSRVVDAMYQENVLPIARVIEEHTEPGEPVLASTDTWEKALACAAPRPTLVDRNGGTYKYAPAAIAGPRWRSSERLRGLRDRNEILTLLEPYGFGLAVVSQGDRVHAGFEVLATEFEAVFENGLFVVVDLRQPR
jgi:hypothetical protein